jgi:DNA-binding beta-propeller fold protein YncE
MRVRARAGSAAAALGAVAFFAGTGAAGEATPQAQPAAIKAPTPVLAMMFDGPPTLFRVRPETLQRVSRPVPMGGGPGLSAFSPDRTMLALGGGSGATLRLVDLRRMQRVGGFLHLGGRGFVTALSWPERGRILALVQGESPRVVIFDPEQRRVVSVRPMAGAISALHPFAGGFVVLVAPADRIGPASLALVSRDGVIRSIPLASVRAGGERFDDGGEPGMRNLRPGLAVDPAGHRAFVVSPGERVTEIDLRTLAVSEHKTSRPRSLFGRLRAWIEPTAQAKSIEGQVRGARWYGGRLIVSGTDYHGLRDNRLVATSQGVKAIDVDEWSVRTLDDTASWFSVVAGRLLVYGAPYGSQTGTGLDAYDASGKLAFLLFGTRHVAYVQTAGRYAYVSTRNSSRHEIVDVASGRVLRTVRTKGPLTLLSSIS